MNFFQVLAFCVIGIAFHCGVDKKEHRPRVLPGRRHRRLELNRSSSSSSLRIHFEYLNFDLGSTDDNAFFKNELMYAVQQFYANVLKVPRVQEPIVVPKNACGDSKIEIPEVHQSDGVEDSDFVIYVASEDDSDEEFFAYVWTCLFEDSELNHPYVAAIVVNAAHLNKEPFETLFNAMVHQVAHVLGFNKYAFDYFNKAEGGKYGVDELYITRTLRGTEKVLIKSPTVLSKVREAYNCNTLEGYELEKEEGSDLLSSHWEMRIAYNDLMVGQILMEKIYSSITMALFEDSGWYTVDYSFTRDPILGYKAGCDFHTNNCVIDGVAQFDGFCDAIGAAGCDPFYVKRSSCNLITHTSLIPREYQYFSDSSLGGSLETIDYCPIMDITNPSSCRDTDTSISSDAGEIVCSNCRCFLHTLSRSASSITPKSGCYEVVSCGSGSAEIRVATNNGLQTVRCSNTGENVAVPSMNGFLTCPDLEVLFGDIPCPNDCYGMGKCVAGVCECLNESTFSDCADFKCDDQYCATCTSSLPKSCTSCIISNMIVEDGECVCPEHHLLTGEVCVYTCEANCNTCDPVDPSICTSCFNNMEVMYKQCYCPKGYESVTPTTCQKIEDTGSLLAVSLALFLLLS